MGAEAFAERAARELPAIGETACMHKVFAKLAISSRNQLDRALAGEASLP